MEYISESPNHCSKGVIQCVQKFINIPVNKFIGYMFETNCSSLYQQFKNIFACYNKHKVKNPTFPILIMYSWPNQNN